MAARPETGVVVSSPRSVAARGASFPLYRSETSHHYSPMESSFKECQTCNNFGFMRLYCECVLNFYLKILVTICVYILYTEGLHTLVYGV